jgi:hypothetical protein
VSDHHSLYVEQWTLAPIVKGMLYAYDSTIAGDLEEILDAIYNPRPVPEAVSVRIMEA